MGRLICLLLQAVRIVCWPNEVSTGNRRSGRQAGTSRQLCIPANGKPLVQPAAQRVGGRVGAPSGADLAVEVGDVPLDRVRAETQPAGDLSVRLASRD